MQNSEFVGMRFPPDLLAWIDRQAEKDRRTRSDWIRVLIEKEREKGEKN